MANEYLRRTPTSTGNRRVWTASLWYKMSSAGAFFGAGDGSNAANSSHWWFNSDQLGYSNNDGTNYVTVLRKSRDFSSWSHYMLVVDTTKVEPYDRVVFYENGVRNEVDTTSGYTNPSRNAELSWINQLYAHHIGARNRAGANTFSTGEYCDFFFIDGQALTPDVFGFYKQGKGYISAGSTQATDFRPGQWVPKTPRVIKTEIIRRGGFGVNGFYLPMNDSNNFGADFHGDPNSIITLNEKLPQPRVGVATTASVGLGYTDALRADPYAANLVLALPFVSGGLSSGFGDYAPSIKGSGSVKTLTNTTAVSIATTAGYYGSAANFGGSHYLTASYNSDFNFGTGDFTVEMWVYPTAVSDIRGLFAVSGGSGGVPKMVFHLNSGTPSVHYNGLTNASDIYTAASSAIPANQWTHLAYVRKGTTWTWFANGVATGTGTNTTVITFTTQPYYVGYGGEGYFVAFNGYLQDLRIYKGVAKYTGGFDVPRPYTPVGIATWRAVPDTTANNFATWTPNSGFIGRNSSNVRAGSVTLTDGNLTWYRQQNSIPIYSTANVRTGKWYWEYLIRGNTRTSYGIVQTPHDGGFGVEFGNAGDYAYMHEGGQTKIVNGSSSSAGSYFASVPAVNDIVGVAFDANTGQLWFSKNGTFGNSGNPSSGTNALITGITTDTQYNFAVFGAGDYPSSDTIQGSTNFGQNPTFSGSTTAGTFTDSNGKGLFKYQPPSGFLALCEDNLPTPAISNPGQYFKTVLYRGSGASRNLVGIGFTPDLVWIKGRDVQTNNHVLFDSVRGATSGGYLMSAQTSAETPNSTMVLSFDNDGFSLGSDSTSAVNNSSINYVAWCWRAGAGTTSTNTNGSITSVVSVNQDAGFSIVSYTGNGNASATVGHGLGRTPAMVIVKCRNEVRSWIVFHRGASPTPNPLSSTTFALGSLSSGCLSLNLTNGTFTYTMDGQTNLNGNTYIAYCWAEIEGFSKFGSYVGNGSADGPFVYTGGKPAFVMIKRIDGSGGWSINDSSRNSTNPVSLYVNAESAGIEATAIIPDFLSNGFKIRDSANQNVSGATYIYACWMESPFTTANSK